MSEEPVGSDDTEAFPMVDTLNTFDSFEARLFEETGNVEAVLDGDLDAFIEAELRRGAEQRRSHD